MNNLSPTIKSIIEQAIKEDIGEADHTSLATIPAQLQGHAKCLIKDNGIIAGLECAEYVYHCIDPKLHFKYLKFDGDTVNFGDIAFEVSGNVRSLLGAERVALNIMQRMSGIATLTHIITQKIEGTKCKVLDTRKTTPLFRALEKWAVRIGGGVNHRFGLYDMILIKDNHIDACGGIYEALVSCYSYLEKHNISIPVEIEVRSISELEAVIKHGKINRILLDNMDLVTLKKATEIVNGKYLLEASGNININNAKEIAETGVDYISIGALTHSVKSLDMSIKINQTVN